MSFVLQRTSGGTIKALLSSSSSIALEATFVPAPDYRRHMRESGDLFLEETREIWRAEKTASVVIFSLDRETHKLPEPLCYEVGLNSLMSERLTQSGAFLTLGLLSFSPSVRVEAGPEGLKLSLEPRIPSAIEAMHRSSLGILIATYAAMPSVAPEPLAMPPKGLRECITRPLCRQRIRRRASGGRGPIRHKKTEGRGAGEGSSSESLIKVASSAGDLFV